MVDATRMIPTNEAWAISIWFFFSFSGVCSNFVSAQLQSRLAWIRMNQASISKELEVHCWWCWLGPVKNEQVIFFFCYTYVRMIMPLNANTPFSNSLKPNSPAYKPFSNQPPMAYVDVQYPCVLQFYTPQLQHHLDIFLHCNKWQQL